MVDALQIWETLAESEECREAKHHYRKYNFSTDLQRSRAILESGSADFDQKYRANDENEKNHYKTDYYVSRGDVYDGYMNMHLEHNLAAFRHCFKDGIPQSLLLVDFGCGPMTSGLALADILSKRMPDCYKTDTAYFGIDASRNMVAKAQQINEEHGLFEHFKVVQDTRFDSQAIPALFPAPQIIVLLFSYVLSPDTYLTHNNAIEELATDWKEYVENQRKCQETRIIYLNPLRGKHHPNWHNIKRTLTDSAGQFCYTRDRDADTDGHYTRLAGECHPTYCSMIRGTRK